MSPALHSPGESHGAAQQYSSVPVSLSVVHLHPECAHSFGMRVTTHAISAMRWFKPTTHFRHLLHVCCSDPYAGSPAKTFWDFYFLEVIKFVSRSARNAEVYRAGTSSL